MFELLALSVALLGTLGAGIWDLKTTDIPDKPVLAMIGAGFFLGAAQGFLTGSWLALAESLIVALAFTAFALIMYFAGAWGGGDGALLVAVGALLPSWPFASGLSFLPFPLLYFLSVFVTGLFYSVIYLSIALRRSKKARRAFSKEFSMARLAYIPIAVLLLIFLPFVPVWLWAALAAVLVIVPPVYALSNASETLFYRKVSVKSLRPGDVIGEDIPHLKLYKRQIRGLTKKEITRLRKAKKSVMVRSGVRYGIVFFLAMIPLLLAALL